MGWTVEEVAAAERRIAANKAYTPPTYGAAPRNGPVGAPIIQARGANQSR